MSIPPFFPCAGARALHAPTRREFLYSDDMADACVFLMERHDGSDIVNIGTLFAFVLVALGIIILRRTNPDRPRPFRTPFVPVVPAGPNESSAAFRSSAPDAGPAACTRAQRPRRWTARGT